MLKKFGEQLEQVRKNPALTRSNKILIPIHTTIANIACNKTKHKVICLPEKEFNFETQIGNKKVDIAIVDKNNQLKGAIMFKAVRSEYNKNANNYYENMKGESSLFIDNNIPIYQIIFIPTKIPHKNNKGEIIFEEPTEKSFLNYNNFITNHNKYWNGLKLGVYYFDVDYSSFDTQYSNKRILRIEENLTQGISNFMEEIDNG